MPTYTVTFDVDLGYNSIGEAISLSQNDTLEVRFTVKNSTTANYTASISTGELKASSLAASTGYSSTVCPYFHSASIATSTDEIILNRDLTNFYNANSYLFVPNPLTGSENSLYSIYGDVDYKFELKPFDILILYLSDNTYIESRIISVNTDSNNYLRIKIDKILSQQLKNELASGNYSRALFLTRVEDETNAYITYRKRPGATSYGLAIPSNIHPDVMGNINDITTQLKQKLVELGGIDGGVL